MAVAPGSGPATATLESGWHNVPVLEGARSRRHRRVPIWTLRLIALTQMARTGRMLSKPRSFLQFAGFPRSGHSLIGSLVDAHPDAIVSHELDTMGLVENGLRRREIFALVARNSAEFMANGRSWNGFAYIVPDAAHGRAAAPRVIGDKKGDRAVRRSMAAPDLLERLHARMGMPCKRILVVRNPFDDIATMSMRRGSACDKLRIGAGSPADFAAALAAGKGTSVPDRADDAMIDDYLLCEGIERLRAGVAARPDPAAQFPIEAEAMLALAGAGASPKPMLHRGNVLPSRGGHHPIADPARMRFADGQPLAPFARATDPGFRFALPFRVDHFRWTDHLRTGLERRHVTPGVSDAGREYDGKLLAYLDRNGGIDLGDVVIRTGADRGMGWRAHVARLRAG